MLLLWLSLSPLFVGGDWVLCSLCAHVAVVEECVAQTLELQQIARGPPTDEAWITMTLNPKP